MVVLASSSPRRRELIALGGWQFQIVPARVDETPLVGECPVSYVLRLAEAKARAVLDQTPAGSVVLGVDTTVMDGDEILGKPRDLDDARAMLQRLRGRSHEVYSALAAIRPRDGVTLTDLCKTVVPMRAYGDQEIEAYIASGDPLDKAGAYAIQHPGFRPVDGLNGCYANVMGLPLCHLTRTLARMGIQPGNDVPGRCQQNLNYDCPVFGTILNYEIEMQ